LYQYAAANPISLIDPAGTGPTDGMSRCDPEDNGTTSDIAFCMQQQDQNGGASGTVCLVDSWESSCRNTYSDPELNGEEAEFWNNAALDNAYAYQLVAEEGGQDPQPPSARTFGQCLSQNTAPVTGEFGRVVGSVAAGLGAGLIGLGRLVVASGRAQAAGGTVDIDIFRAVAGAAGSLVERGISAEVAGAGAIATGTTVIGAGVYTAAGTGALAASYFGASAIICAVDRSYGSR
ncbi:MAG: hypothetical protein ACRETL_13875, partial [Gammaproteobacteria bacterium]